MTKEQAIHTANSEIVYNFSIVYTGKRTAGSGPIASFRPGLLSKQPIKRGKLELWPSGNQRVFVIIRQVHRRITSPVFGPLCWTIEDVKH